jgi:hypothetical protein
LPYNPLDAAETKPMLPLHTNDLKAISNAFNSGMSRNNG